MLYRKFGKTNEMVSALGFGCMRLPILPGGNQSQIDEEKSMKLVRFAIDEGVNYIDTAYPYHGTGMGSGGASEPFVAKVLKDGYREKVKLATKLPSWLIKTREDMDKYLNEQLQRLETDSIDFYLVHALNVDTWTTLKTLGISEFLDAAIKDGRIKYAGFSFHDKLPLFKEIVDYYDWSFCQIQYNYLDEDFQAGTEGLKYASQKGLGITIMEPLRGGKLAANLPKEAINVFDKADVKRTPVDWALSWVWNHPEVSVILSGMNEMKQIVENIKTANMAKVNSLTDEELKIVTKVKTVIEEKVKVSCTACEYCMPCPAGVNIPKNFTFYNNHFMFDKEENYSLAVPNKEKASNCIECGKCETHCPQGISIRAELKNVKELFE
ncbi:aldo/keto reductase [Clostridium estertheticum]|uniref:aldo/keto reductase n=1 Tax=Clostridium estertheticum TaxID=238834 RepID=UPI001CF4B001|nr:aldo/keto reductase [Clostridium estertheticum]MCB2307959.1 aldo/keto reductase [Clostridium estertheticum]MCB2346083.1 aldo/keto reductase [Clostridium estertheticum]MCB2351341.1 aldo/keto reductase [Clostridium estertheticum]WAG44226.1 aldo/keto reductase [Clostridium estertheticum]